MAGDVDPAPASSGRLAWGEIYEALVERASEEPLGVDDLERLAEAAYFTGRDEESLQAWERAHQMWVHLGDSDRAAQCAFWIGLLLLLRGEAARANGWFSRGRRIVSDVDTPCAGYGYLLVPSAMEALESGDTRKCAEIYDEIAEIAEQCGDGDLIALARLGRGEAALAAGDTRTGLALLDEAMVSATTGEVSPIATGILYCAVLDACVQAFDLRRAAEWTEALTRWCEGQADLVPYRGQCLVHRSQVLQAHGAWSEALEEASRARARLAQPPHPAVGVAFYQLGELHRLRGDFDKADDAYRQATEHGRPPTPGAALLHLGRGEVDLAVVAVRRMLDESRHTTRRLPVLPAYVEIMVAAGDVQEAGPAADELAELASGAGSRFLTALADHARSTVMLALERPAEALDTARRACEGWHSLGMPYEAARSQVVVGLACRMLGDGGAAEADLRAARSTFERLGARPDTGHVDELLRSPAESSDGGAASDLTSRELEVLRLVAGGSTNRDIAAALVISEHTVARHLQNIFVKLGVSSRSAATAHAYRHGLV